MNSLFNQKGIPVVLTRLKVAIEVKNTLPPDMVVAILEDELPDQVVLFELVAYSKPA